MGKDWSLLIKNVFDQFPSLSIVYSGSSLLQIETARGDLSRRQGCYELKGLSFREFLAFEGVYRGDVVQLEDLLRHHREIAQPLLSAFKVLPLFDRYLRQGYYPFYREPGGLYEQRLGDETELGLGNKIPLCLFGFLY